MRTTAWAAAAVWVLVACKGGNRFEEMARRANLARDAGAAVKSEPPEATLLASAQNVPRSLFVDGLALYWHNEGGRWEGEPGLFKLLKTGGTPVALVRGADVLSVAADDAHLYWLEPRSGRVMRVSKSGGEPEKLFETLEVVRGLAVDERNVYWLENQAISSVPKAGGKAKAVVTGIPMPDMLSVDGTHVYWYSTVSGALYRAPKTGGRAQQLYTEDKATLHAMLVDGPDIFFSYGAEKKMQIHRLAKGGGKPTLVVGGQNPANGFALTPTHIYWTTDDAIFRVERSGGTATAVVEKTDRARDAAIDGATVYWTDRGGRVQKLAR